jgi:hypothetical protein
MQSQLASLRFWSSSWLNAAFALLAALGAASVALGGLNTFLEEWGKSAPWIKWAIVGVLGFACVFALLSVLAGRSLLLRPECFQVDPSDSSKLLGRDADIQELVRECERCRVVLLIGESGVGKSALVQSGLIPELRGRNGSSLVPAHIDLSAVAWDGGLQREIGRALRSLSTQNLERLGDSRPPSDTKVFAWIRGPRKQARAELLLILDQFDDYALAHADRLRDGLSTIEPAELERRSQDWREVAQALRSEKLRLVIVCRSDIDARNALRFVSTSSPEITRVRAPDIASLLDQIAQPGDGEAAVVRDPQYGWHRLRDRLLRDLSVNDGRVLPIQLVVAVESLKYLRDRELTVSAYQAIGGLVGLERTYVERRLQDTATVSGVPKLWLLRGLLSMVGENGAKTRRAAIGTFAQAVLGRPGATSAKDARVLLAIKELERKRILRRSVGESEDSLLLHHDFLARGIWDVYRRLNRFSELLRERTRSFDQSSNWRERWTSLLTLRDQLRCLTARLGGAFEYGEHARIARWSCLRVLPIALAFATLWLGADRALQARVISQMESLVARIGHTDGSMKGEETEALRSIARAKQEARFCAARAALVTGDSAERAIRRIDQLIRAIVGFDADGSTTTALVREFTSTVIRAVDHRVACAAAQFCVRLNLGHAQATELAAALVERMRIEDDSDSLSTLGDALGTLVPKLEPKQAHSLAAALVERIKTRSDWRAVSALGDALETLSPKLGPTDAQLMADALVERMNNEGDWRLLSELGDTLGTLLTKVDSRIVQFGAAALVARMKIESDSSGLSVLGDVLGRLSPKLDPKDAKALAAALAQRLKTEDDWGVVSALGDALGTLSAKLESADVQPMAAALVERMNTEDDWRLLSALGDALGALLPNLESNSVQLGAAALVKCMEIEADSLGLSRLGWTLGELSPKLEPEDVQPGVAELVERMETESGSFELWALGDALGKLSPRLEAKDLQRSVATLVKRMRAESDYARLAMLGIALGGLSPRLEPMDVQLGAAALVERMMTEDDPDRLSVIGGALESMSSKLDPKDARPIAAALVQRMTIEGDFDLSTLAEALGALSPKLESKDARPMAAELVERMKIENDIVGLRSLGQALGVLSPRLELEDARPLAAALAERMSIEGDSRRLSALGDALGTLVPKLEPRDVKRSAVALVERMKIESDSGLLSALGRALGTLVPKLEPQDVQSGAAALVERMKIEVNSQSLSALGDAFGTLVPKLAPMDARELGSVLVRKLKSTDDSATFKAIAAGLQRLSQRVPIEDLPALVACLADPLSAPSSDTALLRCLEAATGKKFDDDFWVFAMQVKP